MGQYFGVNERLVSTKSYRPANDRKALFAIPPAATAMEAPDQTESLRLAAVSVASNLNLLSEEASGDRGSTSVNHVGA